MQGVIVVPRAGADEVDRQACERHQVRERAGDVRPRSRAVRDWVDAHADRRPPTYANRSDGWCMKLNTIYVDIRLRPMVQKESRDINLRGEKNLLVSVDGV